MAGCAFTLAVWTSLFGIYRYVIALEMLAAILIAGAILSWPLAPRLKLAAIALALAFVTVTARPGSWTRLPEWTDRFVERLLAGAIEVRPEGLPQRAAHREGAAHVDAPHADRRL